MRYERDEKYIESRTVSRERRELETKLRIPMSMMHEGNSAIVFFKTRTCIDRYGKRTYARGQTDRSGRAASSDQRKMHIGTLN